jgi:hypothetical protein
MSTAHKELVTEELARQLLAEFLHRGESEKSAREQASGLKASRRQRSSSTAGAVAVPLAAAVSDHQSDPSDRRLRPVEPPASARRMLEMATDDASVEIPGLDDYHASGRTLDRSRSREPMKCRGAAVVPGRDATGA